MEGTSPNVLVVLGSDSDFTVMESCLRTLKQFDIAFRCVVCSAHRTPDQAAALAKGAYEDGIGCIIAAAGKAAHLPGVLAAFTVVPVIGVPIRSDSLDGMDALLSISQMPPGIPVATVAINGASNAAILAAEILSGRYPELTGKLLEHKTKMAEQVAKKNEALQAKIAEL